MTQRDERIAKRAHDLWEQEGRPDGRHEDHWHKAAKDIAADKGEPAGAEKAKKPRAAKAEPAEAAPKRTRKAADVNDAEATTPPRATRKPKAKSAE